MVRLGTGTTRLAIAPRDAQAYEYRMDATFRPGDDEVGHIQAELRTARTRPALEAALAASYAWMTANAALDDPRTESLENTIHVAAMNLAARS